MLQARDLHPLQCRDTEQGGPELPQNRVAYTTRHPTALVDDLAQLQTRALARARREKMRRYISRQDVETVLLFRVLRRSIPDELALKARYILEALDQVDQVEEVLEELPQVDQVEEVLEELPQVEASPEERREDLEVLEQAQEDLRAEFRIARKKYSNVLLHAVQVQLLSAWVLRCEEWLRPQAPHRYPELRRHVAQVEASLPQGRPPRPSGQGR